MATHSSILAWKVPWTEEPGGLQSMGHKESDTTEGLTHTQRAFSSCGEWGLFSSCHSAMSHCGGFSLC